MRCSWSRVTPTPWRPRSAACSTIRVWPSGWRGRRMRQRPSTRGRGEPSARIAAVAGDLQHRMISPTLLSLVRCPDCRCELREFVCVGCGRRYPPSPELRRTSPVRRTISTCGLASSSRSRPSTWTRRCTSTRGMSASRRRSLARRSATTCCETSWPRVRVSWSSTSDVAAGARCSGTATLARR